MDKLQLIEILQACLLCFEGVERSRLESWITPRNVEIGSQLNNFLQQEV